MYLIKLKDHRDFVQKEIELLKKNTKVNNDIIAMNYKNLNLKIFDNLINDIKLIIDTPKKELIEKRKVKEQKEKELKSLKENIINTLVNLEKINSKIIAI